jgi:hypothetical protein
MTSGHLLKKFSTRLRQTTHLSALAAGLHDALLHCTGTRLICPSRLPISARPLICEAMP